MVGFVEEAADGIADAVGNFNGFGAGAGGRGGQSSEHQCGVCLVQPMVLRTCMGVGAVVLRAAIDHRLMGCCAVLRACRLEVLYLRVLVTLVLWGLIESALLNEPLLPKGLKIDQDLLVDTHIYKV